MNEGQTQFIDAEQQVGGNFEGLTFRTIVLNQVQRIASVGSKEFRGGYWQKKYKMVSGLKVDEEYYVPDSRKEYANSINMLYDLMIPKFDKIMMEDDKKIKEELEVLVEKAKSTKMNSDDFANKEVRIYRKLWQALSNLLNRLDYLQSYGVEEE